MAKTIKIFVASSNELDYERQVIGNLVRHLNDIYEGRGLRIKLDEWEPLDNNRNTEEYNTEEYNTKVRESNMFLALLHRQHDKSVIEKFEVARGAENTKPYVYFKEVNESQPEEKLDEFKDALSETEYFWINFTNRDTLRFHFVMQFHLVEDTLNANDIKVEDGKIWLEGKPFLHANELSFVGSNTLIKKWSERLNVLEAKENKNDEEKKEYFKLKGTIQNLQKAIINVAKQMARYHGQRITFRLISAINAFDAGDIQEVSEILAEAPQDGKIALQTYQQATEVQQQSRENVINHIKEIAFLASNTMADMETIPSADERVEKAHKLYAQADKMAQAINYDPKEYKELLLEYANFLFKCGKYKDAEEVYLRHHALCKNLYSEKHIITAHTYNIIGIVRCFLGKYNEALTNFDNALKIFKEVLGKEKHRLIAYLYNDIGLTYSDLGKYDEALVNCRNALNIFKEVLGEKHDTAEEYNYLGVVYRNMGKYDDALKCHSDALKILKKWVGEQHETAYSYACIGSVYSHMGKYNDALKYCSKALEIRKQVLPSEHPSIARSYINIGGVYHNMGKYNDALKYYSDALKIYEKVLPSEHPDIANVHKYIGDNLFELKRYEEAKEHLQKALDIYKKEPSKHQESILNILEINSIISGAGAPKGGISFKFKKFN